MKILALILARGGSKRIPRKNLQLVGGKSLVLRTLESARGVSGICDILVSTDDKEIADILKENGALVPWLRPKNLSGDRVSSVDAALHALDYYETKYGAVDGLLLLQPTTPFRNANQLSDGIKLFQQEQYRSIVGVAKVSEHPMWMLTIENDRLIPFLESNGFSTRSQDLPNVYIPTGSFYLISPKELRKERSFIGINSKPLIIQSEIEKIDIDTEWDLKLASLIAKNLF